VYFSEGDMRNLITAAFYVLEQREKQLNDNKKSSNDKNQKYII
jgi:hypothetical protein